MSGRVRLARSIRIGGRIGTLRLGATLVGVALGLGACADSDPNVVFETELGAIEIEVYPDRAPISAGDFLYYVDQGLYDGEGFYRTVRADNDPRDMGMSLIQGGRLDLQPVTPGIEHERTSDTGLSNVAGSVSIARDAPGTGSAAFIFINIGDNLFLDYGGARNADGEGYAVFGHGIRPNLRPCFIWCVMRRKCWINVIPI